MGSAADGWGRQTAEDCCPGILPGAGQSGKLPGFANIGGEVTSPLRGSIRRSCLTFSGLSRMFFDPDVRFHRFAMENLSVDRNAFLFLLFFLAVGCGADEESSKTRDSSAPFRVVMVMDMAGLGDKGFNDAGWAGVQRAVAELGIEANTLQSNEQADYVPNLGLAAQQADAVVAMGFLMIDAVKRVAPLYPETVFIFVDGEIPGENIASFDFKAQEGAYLAGILAAMTSRAGKVGCVLGMDIPPVRAYEAGYRAGVLTVNRLEGRQVDYVSATVGDFNNPSRGKALTQGLLAQGADVVLQLAGNTGLVVDFTNTHEVA